MTVASQALGRYAEDRVARWYRDAGYRIVARNWRCPAGEIDLIVASPSDVIAFCEVKARASDAFGSPFAAVTPAKQRRLRGAASAWLQAQDSYVAEVRFDVASVVNGKVDVLENAF